MPTASAVVLQPTVVMMPVSAGTFSGVGSGAGAAATGPTLITGGGPQAAPSQPAVPIPSPAFVTSSYGGVGAPAGTVTGGGGTGGEQLLGTSDNALAGAFGPIPELAQGGSISGGGPADLMQTIAALTQQVQTLLAAQGNAAPTANASVQAGGPSSSGCGCDHGTGGSAGAPPVSGASPDPIVQSNPAPPADPKADVRKRIVDIAGKEVGVKEEGGGNRGARIVEYRKAVTGPGEDPNAAEPWCADFASWVMRQAGVPIGKDGQGDDYTVSLVNWGKGNGRWFARGSRDPQPGDLIFFDWKHDGTVDHVGIVDHVANGKVYTIEGNSADSVARREYALGAADVSGYISAT